MGGGIRVKMPLIRYSRGELSKKGPWAYLYFSAGFLYPPVNDSQRIFNVSSPI
jgi:hypothetical protein